MRRHGARGHGTGRRPSLPLTLVNEDGEAPAATFTVVPAAARLNLPIPGLWLTQVVQTPDRSVPLVQGREAYLRVQARPTS